ncbi:MAG: allantoate deiminase [Clostridiaceae bacterium]|mgnify:CR=1 FL=1|nr:allantoate deiminase [Clostridiaceae bacterium]
MIEVTTQEVDQLVAWLSSISDGEEEGVTRLLYSPSWNQAVKELADKFEEIGMKVEYDEVGNLYGTIEGTEEPDSIIATGSHVDTVVSGGSLDGQLGILSSYLAIRELLKDGKPKKSLRIIVLAEEEGSRFPYAFWGSKNVFGIADRADVEDIEDSEGIKFVDAMRESGFDFLDGEPRFKDMDAFVELHIEQGNALEKAGLAVGVVNSIVGQKRFDVTLKGEANHAGTTKMVYRRDAVDAMSRMMSQCLDKAREIGDPLVLTFGHITVVPNVVNVVPGEVTFSIDCRHTTQEDLDEFAEWMVQKMEDVATDYNIDIDVDMWMDEAPVPMDEDLVKMFEEVCAEGNLDYQVMHSGAGHDAQIFGPYVPTVMIFVPSIDGISHNPAEATKTEEIVQGIKALAEGLRRLAY